MRTKVGKMEEDAGRRKWRGILREEKRKRRDVWRGKRGRGKGWGDGFCDKAD